MSIEQDLHALTAAINALTMAIGKLGRAETTIETKVATAEPVTKEQAVEITEKVAEAVAPAEEAPAKPKRRRRTKAEMEAVRAAEAEAEAEVVAESARAEAEAIGMLERKYPPNPRSSATRTICSRALVPMLVLSQPTSAAKH